MSIEAVLIAVACVVWGACVGVAIGLELQRKTLDAAFDGWQEAIDALEKANDVWAELCRNIIDHKYNEATS